MPESNSSRDIVGTPYGFEESRLPSLKELSEDVIRMRKAGQLTPRVLSNIRRYFRIKNIYHSNAIEGNVLDVGETRQVVEHGLTITGKPLKDQAEAKNLGEALDFLEDLVKSSKRSITGADVRQIHHFVLKDIDDSNAGQYRSVDVEISGSDYKPPAPADISSEMRDFGKWLSDISVIDDDRGTLDAILYAAAAHTWLVYIHPFIDGNGRVARLLMNLILMRYGYPIAIVTKEDRFRYYDALEISQTSDLSPFIALVEECIRESLEEYERSVREQQKEKEWAADLVAGFSPPEALSKARNEYEVWKSAMELLRSYFHQLTELLNDNALIGRFNLRDFGDLEFEKYLSLKQSKSAKKTWFFRMDFVRGDISVRYLFFFGSPSQYLKDDTDVTLHLAREEPPGSFHYEKLDHIGAPNVPATLEIGYRADKESFVVRGRTGRGKIDKIENIGKKFFEEVKSCHFQAQENPG